MRILEFIQSLLFYFQAKAPISQTRCVACGSRNLRREALETASERKSTYRCLDCGYEGGEARQSAAEHREQSDISAMSPIKKRHFAYTELKNASFLIESSMGAFALASEAALVDLGGGGLEAGDAKHQALADALVELSTARQHMIRAACALRLNETRPEQLIADEDLVLWAADDAFDGPLVDGVMLLRIKYAKRQSKRMRENVDKVLEQYYPPEVVAQLEAHNDAKRRSKIEKPRDCSLCNRAYDESELNFSDGGAYICDQCLAKVNEEELDSGMLSHWPALVIVLPLLLFAYLSLPDGLHPNRHVDKLSVLFTVPTILIGLVMLWRVLRDKMASRARTLAFSALFVAISAAAGLILYFAVV